MEKKLFEALKKFNLTEDLILKKDEKNKNEFKFFRGFFKSNFCVAILKFDTFLNEIFKNILQLWRKNSNMSKSKVLLKLNFLDKN